MKRLILFLLITVTHYANAQFTAKPEISGFAPGRWGAMSFVLDGKIYVAGGYIGNFNNFNDLQMYDPSTGSWSSKANLPGTNTNRTAGVAFVIGNKAYLGLGEQDYNGFSPAPTYLNDLWEYDAAADTWTQKTALPDTGRGDASVFVLNDKAYVIGGEMAGGTNSSSTRDVWEYDPATNSWAEKAGFPADEIEMASAFSMNGKGYVFGGMVTNAGSLAVSDMMYEYDPVMNAWTQKSPSPGGGSFGGVAFVINNKAYVGLGVTGLSFGSFSKDFYPYDPATNTWGTAITSFPSTARGFGFAQQTGGIAYLGAGWRRDGGSQTFFNDFYEFSEATGITSIENSAHLNCYPNPARDLIYVSADPATANTVYRITNPGGQLMQSGVIGENNAIDINELPAGQYLLQVISLNRTFHSLLLKQ